MRRLSTGFVDIKLSLRTTDTRLGCMLARKLSAESDIIMTQAAHNLISESDARKWLAVVIAQERQKIARLDLIRRLDSSDPIDDQRYDHAMQAALGHIATWGIHAAHSAEATPVEADQIELLRRDLTSDSRRRITLRDYRETTGKEQPSALETLEVMDLYIQGKHAAWVNPNPDEALSGSQQPIENAASGTPDISGAQGSINPEVPLIIPETTPFNPEIREVVARMNALKRSEGIEEKTLRQYESFAALFITLTGISDVRLIRQSHASAFRADLYKLPKAWGKSPKDATATRDEIMGRSANLPPEKVGLSVGTINRHLEHLNQIISWAADEGIAVDPKLKPAKLRRKETTRSRDKRDAFTEGDLTRLFQAPVWQEPGQPRDGNFWGPLLGAYTGARRAEIAGLVVSDVIEADSIPCLHIRHNALRRIKNMASDRILPIHSHLLELGFMAHVEAMRAKGASALFPEQGESRSPIWGRKLGRFMRDMLDEQLGENGASLSFHSFRHYVQNALDRQGVGDKVVRDVIGHEGKDEHEKTYRKQSLMTEMKAAIEALPRVM